MGEKMADEKSAKDAPRKRKSPTTVREHAEKQAEKRVVKPHKIRGKIHRPLSVLRRAGAKEFHPVTVPEKKGVRHLNRRVRFVPKFIRESWVELKQVTWPTKRDAMRLTFAVFIFAAVFTIFIQVIDFVFSKLVKEILLK
jgi:preprotein translocase subunit SecE